MNLKDNRFGAKATSVVVNDTERKILEKYSRLDIKSLKSLGVLCYGYDNPKENSDFLYDYRDGKISTGNLMGVVCLRDEQKNSVKLEITSRFDQEDRPYFLYYLLEKVGKVHIGDFIDSSKESILDMLLAFAFCSQLKAVTQVGLYKEYRKYEYNDLNLRGRVDLTRHIKQNYPLCDKIAYSTREITYDNPLNHLLRYAIAKIERKWHGLLANHSECSELIRTIKENTPTWSPINEYRFFSNQQIQNRVKHPYYAEFYEPLRSLALAILYDEGVSLYQNVNEHKINGIIFDGAWLWEEYIATILEPIGFRHSNTSKLTTGIPVFDDKTKYLYPDFLRYDKKFVLDAKYKRGDSTQSTDIHQVLCYMLLTGAPQGGLIYPPLIDRNEKTDLENAKKLSIESRYWHSFTYEFKEVNNFKEFKNFMNIQEENLRTFAKGEK